MWIMTKDGFVSAVQHRKDPDRLVVRARVRAHLVKLFPATIIHPKSAEVIETPDADYRYRMIMSRGDFEAAMEKQFDGIDYDNFKNSVKDRPYHDALMGVWSTMLRLQPVGGILTRLAERETIKGIRGKLEAQRPRR